MAAPDIGIAISRGHGFFVTMSRRAVIFLFMAIALCNGPVFAEERCLDQRVGINLAGAGFGTKLPGREGYDFRFPTAAQISYYAKIGFRSVRLSVLWERLQPELFGPLDSRHLAGILTFMDAAAANGVDVLVDLHNYSRFNGALIGSEKVPAAAFFDVWQKIARATSNHKALYAYGLMNEPYNTGGLWRQVLQSGVDGVRSVDKTHRIYVQGEGYSPTEFWGKTFEEPFVKDPSNLEVYEAHIYLDADYSGKYKTSDPPKDPATLVDERLGLFIRWLSKHGVRGAVGEWGVPNDDARWLSGVDRLMELARNNCLPTYVWAGGNWSPGYKLSLEPLNGEERVLTKHFYRILERKNR
jgi:endoglucanase